MSSFKMSSKLFILDQFLAVGSYDPYNKKTELFDYGTNGWSTSEDYPFGGPSVAAYDMLYIEELSAFFIIGGYVTGSVLSGDYLATIAKFANGVWSSAGQLNRMRYVSFCSFCFFLNY